MKKLIPTLIAALVMSLGLVVTTPSPSQAGWSKGCVTLREAQDTLKYRAQSKSSVHRGFRTSGAKMEGSTRKAVWRAYRPCVGENSDWGFFVDVVFVRKSGRWVTLYWAYFLKRGEGDNRVHADSWRDHK